MAMFEKIMSALSFDDGYDYDDFVVEEGYEYENDDVEDVAERESLRSKFGNLFFHGAKDDDADEQVFSERAERTARMDRTDRVDRAEKSERQFNSSRQTKTRDSFGLRGRDNSNNVVNLNRNNEQTVANIRLTTFEDVKKITTHLRTGRICIIDLNSIGIKEAQRSLDFICGVADAIDADIQRASTIGELFLITPAGVNTIADNTDEYRKRGVFPWDNK